MREREELLSSSASEIVGWRSSECSEVAGAWARTEVAGGARSFPDRRLIRQKGNEGSLGGRKRPGAASLIAV